MTVVVTGRDLACNVFTGYIAKDAGLEKWIEYDEGSKMYFLTPDMEDDLHGFIDKYNNKQKDFY